MRKICFVTGTRAEYGLMCRLMRLVANDADLQLQVVATNMHLLPEYGETYREIEKDGFVIDAKVPMRKPSDNASGVVTSMAEEMAGMSRAFASLCPDLIVLLGDRYEILVAAEVALIHRIPVAHIHGGEVTEGAFDDAIRHAVTKMSALHFTSCEAYRRRVIQMGEQPERVFNVGSPGVENVKQVPLMSKSEIEQSIGFSLDGETIVATYHPVTLGGDPARDIHEFLAALSAFDSLRVVFTMPNSDTGRDVIAQAITAYVDSHQSTARAFASLGLRRYLSVVRYAKAAVGNSSSGIIEVPSFGIPTLNIGDRQKGRITSESVVNCGTSKDEIIAGLRCCLSPQMQLTAQTAVNPYDKAGTAATILDTLKRADLDALRTKHFYDLDGNLLVK